MTRRLASAALALALALEPALAAERNARESRGVATDRPDRLEAGALPELDLSVRDLDGIRDPRLRDMVAATLGDDRPIVDTPLVMTDIETSSFIGAAEVSTPIEIGAIRFRFDPDGRLRAGAELDELIDPRLPLDRRVTELTALTSGDLKGKPGIETVLPRFVDFLGRDSLIFAQNAKFDVGFLGYRMKEQGLPAPSNLILDTKRIAKAVFPGLKSYSVRDLIVELGIAQSEDHRGVSDSMQQILILGKCLEQAAKSLGIPFADLTLRHVAALSPRLGFETILEELAPKTVEPERLRPVPADAYAEFRRVSEENHRKMAPNMLRDVAYQMGVEYHALRERLIQAHRELEPSKADEILADLKRNPGKAWIMDLNQTILDNAADGIMVPAFDYIIEDLTKLLAYGPVGFITSLYLDFQSPKSPFPNAAWSYIVEKIPAALRRNLFFVGGLGTELITFDAKGDRQVRLESDWDLDEKPVILNLVDESLKEKSIDRKDLVLIDDMAGQVVIRFPKGDARSPEFSKLLAQKFKDAGIHYPVLQNAEWVFFAKYDKSDAIRMLYAAMRERGFDFEEKDAVVFGDDFRRQPNGAWGADAKMAFGLPESRGISVGDKIGDVLPPNVRRLDILNSRGSHRAFEAILEGLGARERGASDSLDSLERVRSGRFAAVFVDVDHTLPREGGLEAVGSALAAGVPVVLNTGRSFDGMREAIESRVPAGLRKRLLFVGRLGSELVSFDEKGEPVREFSDDWTPEERARVREIVDSAFAGIERKVEDKPGISYVILKTGDPRAAAVAAEIRQKADAAGLKLFVHSDGDHWVLVGKNHKGRGARRAFELLQSRGVPAREDNLLALGDEFGVREGGMLGSDGYWAKEFPKSLALDVGSDPFAERAANVSYLGRGENSTIKALDAVVDGRAHDRRSFRIAAAGAVATALLFSPWLWPLLWDYRGAAWISTVLLVGVGLPQIWKDFRKGREAVEDLSISGNWIWLTLSFTFLAVGVLTGSLWFTLSNSFSILKRSVIGAQINYYKGGAKLWTKTGLVLAGGLSILSLALFPVFFSATTWASILLAGGIGLLLLVNLPQIWKDYLHYESTRRPAEGRSRIDVAMLALAGAFGILGALSTANVHWAIVNVISFIEGGVMAGQLFRPKETNGLLKRLFGLFSSRA